MTAGEGDFERSPGGGVVSAPEVLGKCRRRSSQGRFQRGPLRMHSNRGGMIAR